MSEPEPVTYHDIGGQEFHAAGKGGASCPSCSPSVALEQLIAKFVDDVTMLVGEEPQVVVRIPRPLFYGFLATMWVGRQGGLDFSLAKGCDYNLGSTTVRIEPLP